MSIVYYDSRFVYYMNRSPENGRHHLIVATNGRAHAVVYPCPRQELSQKPTAESVCHSTWRFIAAWEVAKLSITWLWTKLRWVRALPGIERTSLSGMKTQVLWAQVPESRGVKGTIPSHVMATAKAMMVPSCWCFLIDWNSGWWWLVIVIDESSWCLHGFIVMLLIQGGALTSYKLGCN